MLHYRIYGNGSPIIMIHGYLSDSSYWTKAIERLSNNHKIVLIDLLGFGDSPKPFFCSYDLDTQINALHEVIKTLNIKRYKIVGHSMGAVIALQYANLFPKDIDKIYLFNMPMLKNKYEIAKSFKKSFGGIYGLLLFTPLGIVGWPTLKCIFRKPIYSKNMNNFVKASKKNSYMSRRNSIHIIEKTNTLKILNSIQIPTILVEGTYDHFFQNNIRINNKKVRVIMVPAGHNPIQTDESLLSKVLEDRI